MKDTIIFKTRSLTVSNHLFRSPRRSYRLSDIEKLSIKRPLTLICLPLAVGFYFLLQEYDTYLYEYEKWVCIFMFTLAPILSWCVGTLSITSKSLNNDDAITGYMPTLKRARTAIESVIFSTYIPVNEVEVNDE